MNLINIVRIYNFRPDWEKSINTKIKMDDEKEHIKENNA